MELSAGHKGMLPSSRYPPSWPRHPQHAQPRSMPYVRTHLAPPEPGLVPYPPASSSRGPCSRGRCGTYGEQSPWLRHGRSSAPRRFMRRPGEGRRQRRDSPGAALGPGLAARRHRTGTSPGRRCVSLGPVPTCPHAPSALCHLHPGIHIPQASLPMIGIPCHPPAPGGASMDSPGMEEWNPAGRPVSSTWGCG